MGCSRFYVNKHYSGRGLMQGLLIKAISWADRYGARIIETYPLDSKDILKDSSIYTGVMPVFCEAGFVEVLRRSERQPIMRKIIR